MITKLYENSLFGHDEALYKDIKNIKTLTSKNPDGLSDLFFYMLISYFALRMKYDPTKKRTGFVHEYFVNQKTRIANVGDESNDLLILLSVAKTKKWLPAKTIESMTKLFFILKKDKKIELQEARLYDLLSEVTPTFIQSLNVKNKAILTKYKDKELNLFESFVEILKLYKSKKIDITKVNSEFADFLRQTLILFPKSKWQEIGLSSNDEDVKKAEVTHKIVNGTFRERFKSFLESYVLISLSNDTSLYSPDLSKPTKKESEYFLFFLGLGMFGANVKSRKNVIENLGWQQDKRGGTKKFTKIGFKNFFKYSDSKNLIKMFAKAYIDSKYFDLIISELTGAVNTFTHAEFVKSFNIAELHKEFSLANTTYYKNPNATQFFNLIGVEIANKNLKSNPYNPASWKPVIPHIEKLTFRGVRDFIISIFNKDLKTSYTDSNLEQMAGFTKVYNTLKQVDFKFSDSFKQSVKKLGCSDKCYIADIFIGLLYDLSHRFDASSIEEITLTTIKSFDEDIKMGIISMLNVGYRGARIKSVIPNIIDEVKSQIKSSLDVKNVTTETAKFFSSDELIAAGIDPKIIAISDFNKFKYFTDWAKHSKLKKNRLDAMFYFMNIGETAKTLFGTKKGLTLEYQKIIRMLKNGDPSPIGIIVEKEVATKIIYSFVRARLPLCCSYSVNQDVPIADDIQQIMIETLDNYRSSHGDSISLTEAARKSYFESSYSVKLRDKLIDTMLNDNFVDSYATFDKIVKIIKYKLPIDIVKKIAKTIFEKTRQHSLPIYAPKLFEIGYYSGEIKTYLDDILKYHLKLDPQILFYLRTYDGFYESLKKHSPLNFKTIYKKITTDVLAHDGIDMKAVLNRDDYTQYEKNLKEVLKEVASPDIIKEVTKDILINNLDIFKPILLSDAEISFGPSLYRKKLKLQNETLLESLNADESEQFAKKFLKFDDTDTGDIWTVETLEIIRNKISPHIYDKLVPLDSVNSASKKRIAKVLKRSIVNSSTVSILENDKNSAIPISKFVNKDTIKKALKFNNFDVASINRLQPKKNETASDFRARLQDKFDNLKIEDPKIDKVIDEDGKEKAKALVSFLKYFTDDKRHGEQGLDILEIFDFNGEETDEFKEFTKNNPKPIIVPAFHGTGSLAASMVTRFGFRIVDNSLIKAGRMLGDGIYFSNVLDKSIQYLGDGSFTRRFGTRGYLFEMDAYLGREGNDYKAAGLGADSIRSPEWVVFDPRAQLKIKKIYYVELTSRRRMFETIKEYKQQFPELQTLTDQLDAADKKVNETSVIKMNFDDYLFEAKKKNIKVNKEKTKIVSFLFLDGVIPISRKVTIDIDKFIELTDGRNDIITGPSQKGTVIDFVVPETLELDGAYMVKKGEDFQKQFKYKDTFEMYISMIFDKNI